MSGVSVLFRFLLWGVSAGRSSCLGLGVREEVRTVIGVLLSVIASASESGSECPSESDADGPEKCVGNLK